MNRTKKYLEQEFNLLKKMLLKYPNYYEYKVLLNIPKLISINFYNLQTGEVEKTAMAEFGEDFLIEWEGTDEDLDNHKKIKF